MATTSADLDTLETLYNALKEDVESAHTIHTDTDTALENAAWESPNAQSFREAWDEFRPKLIAFEGVLADAATDVARNHNNIAAANGVTDAADLADVTAYE
ncbi:MAG: hypothetical protein E7Z95_07990 [Actinomyces succiniciruminis]|uniref:Type VII secretion system ESAT-6-like n=1 Tax=Actinomyces succiniciruminis TaxID=1522002 RepID=A0A1L7RQV5_9ACTO|nr:hypothetical protein [Actinomyces succiniciruminis]MBE6475491.1 hypothetical protein [Actinomyces succiniciruminis]CED91764.1 Type VII secretion system ESAT-6-like [Actinomyces succiniciruminis]